MHGPFLHGREVLPFLHAGAPFRCMGEGGRLELDPQTCRPTLLLIRDMAEQASVVASA